MNSSSVLFLYFLFISFAPPKEMNQRKRGRNRAIGELGEAKCQLQPKLAPATLAILAQPFWLNFAPFPFCLRTFINQIKLEHYSFWIYNGLREFWE
jgi:hypothetical protein